MGHVVDLVKDAVDQLDLEEWLSHYTDLKDGGGSERRLHTCPKCGNDSYKVYVNVDRKCWLCYVCDWGRGVGDIVELMAAVSDRHPTHIRIELASLVVPAPTGDILTQLKDLFDSDGETGIELHEAHEVAVPGDMSFTGITMQQVYAYAKRRGLTDQEIRNYGLRGASKVPARTKLVEGPWLVFPVRMAQKCVAWQGRRLKDGQIKYLSASNIKNWLWPLDDAFFKVYRPGMPVLLVEGVFDAAGFLRYGAPALCTFGKSISEEQMRLLRMLNPTEVIFAWDLDAKKETTASIKRVSFAFPKTSVVRMDAPGDDLNLKVDPGEALRVPWVAPWLIQQLKSRLDVRSSEYFQWQMSRM